jgi:hypothetical protein
MKGSYVQFSVLSLDFSYTPHLVLLTSPRIAVVSHARGTPHLVLLTSPRVAVVSHARGTPHLVLLTSPRIAVVSHARATSLDDVIESEENSNRKE